jgi:hypothetical protein
MNTFGGRPMTRSSRPRRAANLSDSVQHKLNMYALAASAAGVGALALAQPAEAKIVYTPAHVNIAGHVNLDLNHDGIADFTIKTNVHHETFWMNVFSLRQNRVWGNVRYGSKVSASALPPGVRVGLNQAKFQKGPSCYTSPSHYIPCKIMSDIYRDATFSTTSRGFPWVNVTRGYLGLEFHIKGRIHYGWARLNRKSIIDNWVLTGYAYETVPKKPIITGKTKGADDNIDEQPDAAVLAPPTHATLGALAMGAHGLSIWRREESVVAAPEGN